MKKILFTSAALSLMAVMPASAQMMGNAMGGPGMAAVPQSCVSGGQFVPCGPAGMQPGMRPGMAGPGMAQPGMAMEEPEMGRRMTRREMREQRRMSQQGM